RDSFLLHWSPTTPGRYQVLALGDEYLEPLFQTTDTFAVLRKGQYPSSYYAVAPLLTDKYGLRSYTLNYATQGAGCYISNFYALLQNQQTALLTLEAGTLYDVSSIGYQKLVNNQYVTQQTISSPSALSQQFIDTHLSRGVNTYRGEIRLRDGAALY